MLMHLVNGHCGSHVPIESLWQAVLGVTDQFHRGNIPESNYDVYCDELRVIGCALRHACRRVLTLAVSLRISWASTS